MIKKIGRYAKTDSNGFIVPDVAWNNIPPHWKNLINDIIAFVEQQHDDNILSLYIRGSVPRGLAVDHVSDLDLVFLARHEVENLPQDLRDFRANLLDRYPFCTGIEWSIDPLDDLHAEPSSLAKLLKTQCLYMWGENIIPNLSPVKPGLEMAAHLYNFFEDWADYPVVLQKTETQKQIDQKCMWMGKRILRTLFELSALKKPRFTRDLYWCYAGAADVYPEIGRQLYKVLELTLCAHVAKDMILPTFTPVAEFTLQQIHASGLIKS